MGSATLLPFGVLADHLPATNLALAALLSGILSKCFCPCPHLTTRLTGRGSPRLRGASDRSY